MSKRRPGIVDRTGAEPASWRATITWRVGLAHTFVIAALFGLHLWVALQAQFPRSFYDEMVYLGFARLFAGVADMPDLAQGGLGHFGYSIVLAPIFFVLEEFADQYRAVLVLNSVFLTSTYVAIYLLVRRLSTAPHSIAIFVAVVAALYPSYVVFAEFAIAEAIYVPWYACLLLLLYRYLSAPSWNRAVVLGLVAGVGYTLHARSIAVLLCLWGVVSFQALKQRSFRPHFLALFLIPVLFIVGVEQGKNYLETLTGAWYPGGSERVSAVLRDRPLALVPGFAGQLFCLSAGSILLYPLGLTILGGIAAGRPGASRNGAPEQLTAGFVLTSHLFTLIGSVFFLLPEWLHGQPAKILSSRYPEGTLAIIIAAGALSIWLAERDARWRRLVCAGLVGSALVLGYSGLLTAPYIPLDDLRSGLRIETITLIPLILTLSPVSYGKVALVVASLSGSIFLLARWNPLAGLAVVSLCFLGMTWVVQRHFTNIQTAIAEQINYHIVRQAAELPAGSQIAFDLASWHPFPFSYYQLYLPDKTFEPFDSSIGQAPPPSAMLIAGPQIGHLEGNYRASACKPFFAVETCIWLPSEDHQK